MRNFFIRLVLFLLRKHWIKPKRKADVTIPTYYWDIRELRIPDGKARTTKQIPKDFSELYFFPSLAASILSSIKPSIDIGVIHDPNHEFKIVLKTTDSGHIQSAHLIDNTRIDKIL